MIPYTVNRYRFPLPLRLIRIVLFVLFDTNDEHKYDDGNYCCYDENFHTALLDNLYKRTPLNTIIQIHAIQNCQFIHSLLLHVVTTESLCQSAGLLYSLDTDSLRLAINLFRIRQLAEASHCILKQREIIIKIVQ